MTMHTEAEHAFSGRWITLAALADLTPNNVFHRQLDTSTVADIDLSVQNRYVLFRRTFVRPDAAPVSITVRRFSGSCSFFHSIATA